MPTRRTVSRKRSSLATRVEIGAHDVVDGADHVFVRDGRTDDGADRGIVLGAAAQRDLVEFLAVLIDAQNADMADMVMAAGIDAAGDLDLQIADLVPELADRRNAG